MNIEQMREKKIGELYKTRIELRQRYADECLEMRMGKLKDIKKSNKTRKEIARLEIVIGEKIKDKLKKESKNGKTKA